MDVIDNWIGIINNLDAYTCKILAMVNKTLMRFVYKTRKSALILQHDILLYGEVDNDIFAYRTFISYSPFTKVYESYIDDVNLFAFISYNGKLLCGRVWKSGLYIIDCHFDGMLYYTMEDLRLSKKIIIS